MSQHRGAPLASLLVTLLGSLLVGPPVSGQPLAWITNALSDDVSVIDTATAQVVATIPVGDPRGVAVSPDGGTIYVADFGPSQLSVLDAVTLTVVETVASGGGPVGVAVSPDGGRLFVANMMDGTVSFFDTASLLETAVVPVGEGPLGVAVSPDGATAYVANRDSDTLSVVDVGLASEIAVVPVDPRPEGVAVHPDGSTVYVASRNTRRVSVVDTATHTQVGTVLVDRGAQQVAVEADGASAWVTSRDSDTISRFDTATLAVTAVVLVGQAPLGVAVHPDGRTVWVANDGEATVSVVEIASLAVVDTIPVGQNPHAFGLFIGPLAEASLGGAATGVDLQRVLCRNDATGLSVVISPGGAPGWDCEAAGLEAGPGDTVRMLALGRATGIDAVGGSTTGMAVTSVRCRNETGGQQVTPPVDAQGAWDCEAAGLTVGQGDRIRQAISGTIPP